MPESRLIEAFAAGDREAWTCVMTGDLIGTLRYMSPEQALAKQEVVDHRTDVYSLGATLYELLTLEPAFAGDDRQELLRQVAFEEPARPRRLNRAVPAEMETIVLKAMEKNSADRYATAQELADELGRFLKDKPIRARPAGLGRRLRKWGRRHPAWVAAAAALLAAVAVLSGGLGWVANDRATRAQRMADEVGDALKDSADWQQRRRVPAALAAARRAQAALAGGQADAALRRLVEARMNDLDLLAELEEARLEGAAVRAGDFDNAESADRRYGEVLRQFKLDMEAGSVEEGGAPLRDSTVALELASLLDAWATPRRRHDPQHESRCKRLLEVARVADPDGWRSQLRHALAGRDRDALARLAPANEVEHLLPWTLSALATGLGREGALELAEALLREAQRRHPDDFWINECLGYLLMELSPPRLVEAIPFLTAAVALRPKSPGAHVNLGIALVSKGDVEGAISALRQASRLEPDYAEAHHNLGNALHKKGDVDGAIAAYREALQLKKELPEALNGLGVALVCKGDVDRAIAAYREALQLKQDYPEAHCNLGGALREKGQFAEALTHLRRGHELGTQKPGWRYPSAEWVRQTQSLADLDRRATAILKGEARAKNPSELLRLARFCLDRKKYPASAARLYADAFAAEPELAADLAAGDRFAASRAAALAGCGSGGDAATLDETGRSRWRNQALDWLRADLKLWAKKRQSGDAEEHNEVREGLGRWQRDPAFAGVRGPDALAKLLAPEGEVWRRLCADVAATLAQAEEKGNSTKRQAPTVINIPYRGRSYRTSRISEVQRRTAGVAHCVAPVAHLSWLLFPADFLKSPALLTRSTQVASPFKGLVSDPARPAPLGTGEEKHG
jgi:serine/threonine-protein kinase